MYLEIVTPDKALFSEEVRLVQVPGSKGSFEILHQHAPIISTLEQGRIRIVTPTGAEKYFNITGGIVEVNKNKIIVLAETA